MMTTRPPRIRSTAILPKVPAASPPATTRPDRTCRPDLDAGPLSRQIGAPDGQHGGEEAKPDQLQFERAEQPYEPENQQQVDEAEDSKGGHGVRWRNG